VFYNPTTENIKNIQSYIHGLEMLYVIDNSDDCSKSTKKALSIFGDQVEYFRMNGNQGIAKALNKGLTLAKKAGANFVLTMDQDSSFMDGGFQLLTDRLESFSSKERSKIGILSCNHFIEGYPFVVDSHELKVVDCVVTSGNLVNMQVYNEVGSFRDEFFIDEVDVEYCRRLKDAGFQVVVVNKAVLKHCLGDTKRHCFLFLRFMCSHHNYIRRYYITRNRLLMVKLYPDLRWEYFFRNAVSLLKIIMFESDKLRKISFFYEGIRDGLNNRDGRKEFES